MRTEQWLSMLFEMLLIVLRARLSVGYPSENRRQQGYVLLACHLTKEAASLHNDLMSIIMHQQIIGASQWYESMEVTRTGVEDDGDFVARSDTSDEMGGGDSASNRGLLVSILDAFAAEVCSTSLTHL